MNTRDLTASLPDRGYHFRYVDGVWREREGREFFALLSQTASEQAGQALCFVA